MFGKVVDTMPLRLSGSSPMLQESVLEIPNKPGRKSSRHMNDPPLDDLNPRIRVKLCLQVNQEFCSEYTEAESKFHLKYNYKKFVKDFNFNKFVSLHHRPFFLNT